MERTNNFFISLNKVGLQIFFLVYKATLWNNIILTQLLFQKKEKTHNKNGD